MFVAPPAESVVVRREEFVARPIAITFIKRAAPNQFDRPTTIAAVVDIDAIGHYPIGYRLSQLSIEPTRKAFVSKIEMTLNGIVQQKQHCAMFLLVLDFYKFKLNSPK